MRCSASIRPMGLSMRLSLACRAVKRASVRFSAGSWTVVISPSSGGFCAHAARGVDLHAGGKLDGPEPRLPRQAVEPQLAAHAVQLPDDVQKCRLAGMIQIADGLGDDHSHQPCGGRFIQRLGMIAQQQQDLPAALFQPAIGDGRMLGAADLGRWVAARNIVNLQQLVHDLFQIGVFQGAVQLGQGDRAEIDAERLGQAVGRFQAVVERFQNPLQHGPRRLRIGGQMPETPHRRGPQPKADQVVQNLPFAVADHGTDLFQAKDALRRPQTRSPSENHSRKRIKCSRATSPSRETKSVSAGTCSSDWNSPNWSCPRSQAPVQRVEALGVLLENLAGEFQVGRQDPHGRHLRGSKPALPKGGSRHPG